MRTLALVAMAGAADGDRKSPGSWKRRAPGDLAAFERLMRQYERLVLVTALRLLGSLPDAQDVSQEVFLKLYRNLGKLAAEGALPAWLYRVTVNACHDLRGGGDGRRAPVEDGGATGGGAAAIRSRR